MKESEYTEKNSCISGVLKTRSLQGFALSGGGVKALLCGFRGACMSAFNKYQTKLRIKYIALSNLICSAFPIAGRLGREMTAYICDFELRRVKL